MQQRWQLVVAHQLEVLELLLLGSMFPLVRFLIE
jgi:hypothetical protein